MPKFSIHPGLMKTQRLFFACALPKDIREEITRVRSTLRLLFPHGVTWTDPVDFHITLVFLGQMTKTQYEDAVQIAGEVVGKLKPGELAFSLHALDAFPSEDDPRVLMVRVHDENGVASELQRELQRALTKKGIATDMRDWQPHITIGRNKKISTLKQMPHIEVNPLRWATHSIELMGSSVKHTGPKYLTINEFAF